MFKKRIKLFLVDYFMSYDSGYFSSALSHTGLSADDVVIIHASWQALNGFKGRPVDMVNVLKELVGPAGLLGIPSLAYQNESTRDYLLRDKPMNVKRSPSMMGLLSEVFRCGKDVHRSLSPTHFLEDRIAAFLPFALYEPSPI